MYKYIPTYSVEATSGNIKNFVSEHNVYIWKIWIPLIPYLVILSLLEFFIYNMDNQEYEANLNFASSIVYYYFFAILAINWHRLVIRGSDKFLPMKFFNPTNDERWFIVFAIIIGLFDNVSALLFKKVILFLNIGSFAQGFSIGVSLGLISTYFIYRISFIFPARAVGIKMSFLESFRMTKGTFWKFFFSSFFASFWLFCFMMLSMIIIMLPIMLLSPHFEDVNSSTFIIMLPIMLYFQPKLIVIGVTALSNYYMYAMEQQGKQLEYYDHTN